VGFAGYVTKQTFVSSKCQVVYVEECVTQAAFESFAKESIKCWFVSIGARTEGAVGSCCPNKIIGEQLVHPAAQFFL